MIKFIFTQEACHVDEQDAVYIEVQTDREHLEAIVAAFRTFLHHIGHVSENIERVQLVGRERTQGFRRGDGNPDQGDFFAATGVFGDEDTDDGEESGV